MVGQQEGHLDCRRSISLIPRSSLAEQVVEDPRRNRLTQFHLKKWSLNALAAAAAVTVVANTGWLCTLVVMALDLRLNGREFDSRPSRLVLEWVTIFGWVNHLGISPSQLGQPSLKRKKGKGFPRLDTERWARS